MRVAADQAREVEVIASPRRSAAAWLVPLVIGLAIAGLFVAAVVSMPSRSDGDAGRVQTVAQAQICVFGGLQDDIPGDSCAWKATALPTRWNTRKHELISDAWFKLTFQLAEVPRHGLALFTTSFDRTGRVFVNGSEVRAVGSMVEPLPLNWNRSQFVVLPAAMLKSGINELEIQERQYRMYVGSLGAIELGPEDVLRPVWEHRVMWQNDACEVIACVMATVGLVMLGVWLLRRSESSYFWFGCTCWVWTIHNLDFFLTYAPLPDVLWEKVILTANVLRAVVMYMFILRYSGRRMRRLEACLWVYFAVGAVATFAAWSAGQWLDLWYAAPLFATPYFGYLLVREGFKRNAWEGALLLAAVISESGLSWYDAWTYSQPDRQLVFFAQYATPLYVTVVAMSLIRHFVASMTGFERQHALAARALQDANQANKEKNLFFSMVSHELKSPLQSIITVLATEDQRAQGRERRQSLKKIGRAVKYMEAQIRDLFVLSVGDTTKLEMRSEPFEVGELVDEVVASVADAAAAKSLSIEVTRPDDLIFVATDPKRVEQILLNVLENAVKYTNEGSISIRYHLDDSTTLCVVVADTGIGIAPENLGKLFVPYKRFALLDREHNSLGIGLAVVQTLLTHLGGTCDVSSELGVGSTFTLRIPVAVEKEALHDDTTRDALRVLIVDDRPEMLADLKEVAEASGYLVETAGSAPQASNELAVAAFDVVLIDLDMPIKNGFELANEIRRTDGPNSGTCLIAISAGSPDIPGFSVDTPWPFDAYEQKPIDARAMKRIVETRAPARA